MSKWKLAVDQSAVYNLVRLHGCTSWPDSIPVTQAICFQFKFSRKRINLILDVFNTGKKNLLKSYYWCRFCCSIITCLWHLDSKFWIIAQTALIILFPKQMYLTQQVKSLNSFYPIFIVVEYIYFRHGFYTVNV